MSSCDTRKMFARYPPSSTLGLYQARREDSHKSGHSCGRPRKSEFELGVASGRIPRQFNALTGYFCRCPGLPTHKNSLLEVR